MEFDLIVRKGTIVDGTGRPRYRADLGLRDGRIAAIAQGEPLQAHADWILPLPDHEAILAPLLLQGVTTVVAGQCGFSPAPITEAAIPLADAYSEMMRERAFEYRWRSFGEFLDHLEQGSLLLNTACLVGHGALRHAVMGDSTGAPDPGQLDDLRAGVRQAMAQGALGLSAGLAYAPGVFARNDELLPLLREVAEMGGVFTVHGRAYTWVSPFYKPMIGGRSHNIRSVRELLDLARRAGVRIQLSHQICVGRRTWRTHRTVLRDIERAVADGLDVAFDAFPYTCGNTTINVVFPEWFLADYAHHIDDPG
ncbi:MAG: N-acyl-D-amino acid deacylase, partial [Anaerolineae bacterium]